MNIIELKKQDKNWTMESKVGIALGNFDGLHRGHQFLIKEMIGKSKNLGIEPSILLFNRHSKAITLEEKKLELISPLEDKINLLKDMGIKNIFLIEFNKDFMKLSGKEFIEKILIKKLNVMHITVGFDYSFGFKASCDSKDLLKVGDSNGLDINIVKPIYVDGYLISSTIIRNMIKDGQIRKANSLLGRNYKISGKIVSGDGRGRHLGFPTANLDIDFEYVKPKNGVYKSIVRIGQKSYYGITNIGMTPTFDNNYIKVETYILDFKGDIYDEYVELELLDFIREEIRFKSPKDLIQQISKDIDSIS